MPLAYSAAQGAFLPALAIRHPQGLSPEDVLPDFRLRAEPFGAAAPLDGRSVELDLRRVEVSRGIDIGPFVYPLLKRRFTGPRPGLSFDLAGIRFRPMTGSTLWLADSVAEDSFYFKSLLQALLTHAAAIGGSAAMHSGLIEWRGRGYLLIGNSRSGKSSLCMFSLLCGARLVSDDVVMLARDGQRFAGRGFRAYSLLRPSTYEALPGSLQRLTTTVTAEEGTKHLLRLERLGERVLERCTIDAIVLPTVGTVADDVNGTGYVLATVSKSVTIARLMQCLDNRALLPGLVAERAAVSELIVALVRALPCLEVRTSPRFLTEPARCTTHLLDAMSRQLSPTRK